METSKWNMRFQVFLVIGEMAELMLFVSTNFDFVLTVWSILTVVLLWIMTVVCLSNFSFLGIYLLLVAICVTTIEFSKFVQRFICCPEGSIPYKMFHVSYSAIISTLNHHRVWRQDKIFHVSKCPMSTHAPEYNSSRV